MSLNFNLGAIKDYESLDERFGPEATKAMVFQTIIVGLRSITEKNAEEFYTRTKMIDIAYGDAIGGRITREVVRAYIGLTTNATEHTDAVFNKRIAKIVRDTALATKDREEG